MSFNLVDLVKDQLTGQIKGHVSKMLGNESGKADAALGAAVPGLLKGLAQSASTPSGADSLLKAVNDQDDGLIDNLGSLLGGDKAGSAVDSGNKVLGSLFGDKGVGALTGAVSGVSGLSKGGAKSIMGMAAPMVMGVIKRKVMTGGLNAGGLASMLKDQSQNITKAMPAGLEDQLGSQGFLSSISGGAAGSAKAATASAGKAAGKAAGNAKATASSAASNFGGSGGNNDGGNPIWKKIVPILGVLALAWIGMNLFGGKKDAETADPAAIAGDVAATGEAAAEGVIAEGADAVEGATEAVEGVVAEGADAVEGVVAEGADAVEGATDAVEGVVAEGADAVEGVVAEGADAVEGAADAVEGVVAEGEAAVEGEAAEGEAAEGEAAEGEAAEGEAAEGEAAEGEAAEGEAAEGEAAEGEAAEGEAAEGEAAEGEAAEGEAAEGEAAEGEAAEGEAAEGEAAEGEAAEGEEAAAGEVAIDRSSFSLGAISRKFGGVFGTAGAVLGGVTDADSATAALPKIEALSGDLDGVISEFDAVPEMARGPLSKVVSTGVAKLTPLADTVLNKEGVGDVLGGVMGPMMEKLKSIAQ